MSVQILRNMCCYVKENELISDKEKDSFTNCEALLSQLFNYWLKSEPIIVPDYPAQCESHFPAYFISDRIPEEF